MTFCEKKYRWSMRKQVWQNRTDSVCQDTRYQFFFGFEMSHKNIFSFEFCLCGSMKRKLIWKKMNIHSMYCISTIPTSNAQLFVNVCQYLNWIPFIWAVFQTRCRMNRICKPGSRNNNWTTGMTKIPRKHIELSVKNIYQSKWTLIVIILVAQQPIS